MTPADADTILLMRDKPKASATDAPSHAEQLQRRAADWAAGAAEGRALDRSIARRQTPQERLDDGLALVKLAAEFQRRG